MISISWKVCPYIYLDKAGREIPRLIERVMAARYHEPVSLQVRSRNIKRTYDFNLDLSRVFQEAKPIRGDLLAFRAYIRNVRPQREFSAWRSRALSGAVSL